MIRLFSRARAAQAASSPPSVGDDGIVYAIGDIHGRADLLAQLVDRIDADWHARAPCKPLTLILLGDLVDRGPDSAGVIAIATGLRDRYSDVRFIMGNHEEMFLAAARGDVRAARYFLRYGGRATLSSYGLAADIADGISDADAAAWMLAHIPRAHVDFVDTMGNQVAIGDYLFVHAGIRPGVALDQQSVHDLRWIRDPFLNSDDPLPVCVVHGHSIHDTPHIGQSRIGIDTGAYATGALTALGLAGTDRWFLSTADS